MCGLGNHNTHPALPVEVIERVVDSLEGDVHALAACSLTCRVLLPTARKNIWSSIHLPVVHDRNPQARRLADFIALLDANPGLRPYVRSLTWTWASSGGSKPPWSGSKGYPLWEKLPNVRALEFNRIAFFVADPILEFCRMLPQLEELTLNSISAIGVGRTLRTRAPLNQAACSTRKLKRLTISGAVSPKHVSALAKALLEEQLHTSLVDLDLRCTVYVSTRPGPVTSAKALASLLTEVARHLCSCGIPIYATEYSAENVAMLYHSVMRCRNLRSLMIQCDTRPNPATRETLHDAPFLFVEALADRLSRRGDSPLPHLKEVSMWWLQTRRDPAGCLEAFKGLALALVGDRGRFPTFKRLEIRRSVYASRADDEPDLFLSEEILREGLAVLEEANVQLVVSL